MCDARQSSFVDDPSPKKCSARLSILHGPSTINDGSSESQVLLHRIFEKRIQDVSTGLAQRVAVTCNETSLTFSELNSTANKIARSLLRRLQFINKNSRDAPVLIAVSLPPSERLVTVLLAILKSGAAYLPLDETFPKSRLQHILEEAKPLLVVREGPANSDDDLIKDIAVQYEDLARDGQNFSSQDLTDNEDLSGWRNKGQKVACVLYTSGSTGTPKGVILPHHVVINRLQWQWQIFPFEDNEVCCFKTVLSFVDSVAEIFAPILQGQQLVVVSQSVIQDPVLLVSELQIRGVTRLVLVPSLLRALLAFANRQVNLNGTPRQYILPRLRLWVTSGEPLSEELLRAFFQTFPKGKTLCNFYGCTEVMGDVTYAMFASVDEVDKTVARGKVPIGIPISNTAIYLLDENQRCVFLGDKGEIYVSGLNVAAGYLATTGTGQRFLPNNNVYGKGHETLYRTGDYGRIVRGNLYHEGRTDTQIKIRGRRVELAEIEHVASKIPGVNKALVLCHQAGKPTQSIVLFYQPVNFGSNNVPVTDTEVASQLHQRLVSYMLPHVIRIDEIPYLHNGKVDRQSLLCFYENVTRISSKVAFDLAGVKEEDREIASDLLAITSKVLLKSTGGRRSSIDGNTNTILTIDANFFTFGGHSLNALEVLSKLHDHGYCISVADFLQAPTLRHVLQKMCMNYELHPRTAIDQGALNDDSTFRFVSIQNTDEDEAIELLIRCFMEKGDFEKWTKPTYEEYIASMKGWWPFAMKAGLSFVVTDDDLRLLAVNLNFADYCIPTTREAPSLQCITDFISDIEEPHLANLPLTPGSIFHMAMMATDPRLTHADNVRLVCLMEEYNIQIANQMGYKVIMTTNVTELTKDVCVELFGYEVLERLQVNKYRNNKGERIFAAAPEDYFVYICVKFL